MSDFELHDKSGCDGEFFIGYSPFSYFMIGILEILTSCLIFIVLFHRKLLPAISNLTFITYVLPVYTSVVTPLLVVCFAIGVNSIIGIFTTDTGWLIIKWAILRFLCESLGIFLMHPGIGQQSSKRSVSRGLVWTALHCIAVSLALNFGSFRIMLLTVIGIMIELSFYYAILAFVPMKYLPRRPASFRYALCNLLLLLFQIFILLTFLKAPNRNLFSCLTELSFSISEYLCFCVILYAFCEDSLFWQGLYTSADVNLNEPLLGIWDMNKTEVNLVAESVFQLERRVVTIIPFSQLRVDTR
jgi:hypothetical protein